MGVCTRSWGGLWLASSCDAVGRSAATASTFAASCITSWSNRRQEMYPSIYSILARRLGLSKAHSLPAARLIPRRQINRPALLARLLLTALPPPLSATTDDQHRTRRRAAPSQHRRALAVYRHAGQLPPSCDTVSLSLHAPTSVAEHYFSLAAYHVLREYSSAARRPGAWLPFAAPPISRPAVVALL